VGVASLLMVTTEFIGPRCKLPPESNAGRRKRKAALLRQ
jgi:hypothetical protein